LIDMVTEVASDIHNTVDSTGRAESSAGSTRSFWRQQAPTLCRKTVRLRGDCP
jgi:hypothetical protein